MCTGKKRFAISLGLVASFLVSSATLAAQGTSRSTSDWSVLSAVASESKLVVKQKNGKTVEGKLSSVSDDALTLSVKNTPLSIKREDVLSVYQVQKKSATKSTLIGLGVGAGAGAALGGAAAIKDDYGFDKIDHAVTAGLAVIGGAAGALTGYLFGRGGSKRVLIYENK
jgi:hypothetical protein